MTSKFDLNHRQLPVKSRFFVFLSCNNRLAETWGSSAKMAPWNPKPTHQRLLKHRFDFWDAHFQPGGPACENMLKIAIFGLNTHFFILFCPIRVSVWVEKVFFFSPNNPRAPLASISINFLPIGDIFFWRSLKSFFGKKPFPWKFLEVLVALQKMDRVWVRVRFQPTTTAFLLIDYQCF